MSQLEELEKLYAKSKEITIPKEPKDGQLQATLSVKPLALDEMACLEMKEGIPIAEMAKKVIEMLSYTLGVSKEEAGKVQFIYMNELLDTIVKINDLPKNQKSKIDKVKGFMAEKQEAKEEIEDGTKPDKPAEE